MAPIASACYDVVSNAKCIFPQVGSLQDIINTDSNSWDRTIGRNYRAQEMKANLVILFPNVRRM